MIIIQDNLVEKEVELKNNTFVRSIIPHEVGSHSPP